MNEPKTPNLGLNKIDRSSPSTTYFDLDKYLDQNWEKVDEGVATKQDLEELREAVGEIDVPDASLTQKGKVQLSNAVDSDEEISAATPKAVKIAMNEALLAKQLGVEQKANVVAALNSIGVSASTNESWEQLITKITGVVRAKGDAIPSDVRAGKTFSNLDQVDILGTLPEQTTGSLTITPGVETQTQPGGIYGGDIIIPGVVVPANKVAVGTTIAGVAGTMVEVPKSTVAQLTNNMSTAAYGRDLVTIMPLFKFESPKKYMAWTASYNHFLSLLNSNGSGGSRFTLRNSRGQRHTLTSYTSNQERVILTALIVDMDTGQITVSYNRTTNTDWSVLEVTSVNAAFLADSSYFELCYELYDLRNDYWYALNCYMNGRIKYA